MPDLNLNRLVGQMLQLDHQNLQGFICVWCERCIHRLWWQLAAFTTVFAPPLMS